MPMPDAWVLAGLLAAFAHPLSGRTDPAATRTVPVACSGTAAERGARLRAAVEEAPPGTLVLLEACDYAVGPRSGGTSGIFIANRELEIAGVGPESRILLLPPVALGIEIRSGARDILIRDLSIVGAVQSTRRDGTVPPPGMQAIGSYSGQRDIRNVRITRIEVSNVSVGISVGSPHDRACVAGRYVGAEVSYNHVFDIRGTVQGSGYAIHSECSEQTVIRGNLVERAERHSIYQARSVAPELAVPGDLVIEGNIIVQHSPFWRCDRTHRAALVVARSHNVQVMHNVVIWSYQDGISVERDSGTPDAAPRHIVVADNRFERARDQRRSRCGADIWINVPGGAVSVYGNIVVEADGERKGQQHPARLETTAGGVTAMPPAVGIADR
jgi:hypothetical protein